MICVQMTLVLSFEDMSLKFERFDFVFSEWFRKLPSAAFCYHWASLGGVTLRNRNTRQSWFHVEFKLPSCVSNNVVEILIVGRDVVVVPQPTGSF